MKRILYLLSSTFLLGCSPNILVYSDKIDARTIKSSYAVWQSVNEIQHFKWSVTNDPKRADLLIFVVPSNLLSCPRHLGEYHHLEKTILLNEDLLPKLCTKRVTNLISHEIGHFLYLEHTNVRNSLMNDKANLLTRRITNHETHALKYSKYKFLLALYFLWLTNSTSNIN